MPMQYMQLLGIIHVFTRLISWCKRFENLPMAIEFYTSFQRRHRALDMFKEWGQLSRNVSSHQDGSKFWFQEQRSESVFQMQEEGLVDHRHL